MRYIFGRILMTLLMAGRSTPHTRTSVAAETARLGEH